MSFFLTQYEMLSVFVVLEAYLEDQTVTDVTLVPTVTVLGVTQEKGFEKVHVNTTASSRTVDLPSVAGLTKYSPRIVNIGVNDVDIEPNGSDTINGVSGTFTISAQWAGAVLRPDGTGTNWIAKNRITP